MLDVHRLRVLKAVVDTGSVTGAAQRLSYSPSAVSQHINALEREAGTTLLERIGRGVQPTAAGLLLAEHAGGLLARLAEAEHALAALRSGHSGRLRMVAFPTAGAAFVPSALAAFREKCPDVAVDLTVLDPEDGFAAVRAGDAELAVVVNPTSEFADMGKGLVIEHLIDDPYRVVLPRNHQLASRRSINLADLADESWVATTSCPGYCQQQADDACLEAGFTPHVTMQADDYPATQGFVAAGLGVALVPMLGLGAVHDGVVVRRIKGQDPVRPVCVATRQALVGDGIVPLMLQALREAARKMQAATR
jgi:DNA-binding transcriptional LysR family regulator